MWAVGVSAYGCLAEGWAVAFGCPSTEDTVSTYTATLHMHGARRWEARSYVNGQHAVTAWFNGEAYGPRDTDSAAYDLAVGAIAGLASADAATCPTGECDREDFRCDVMHAICTACGHCNCGNVYQD